MATERGRAVPPVSTVDEGTVTRARRVPAPEPQKMAGGPCDPCVMGQHTRCTSVGCYGCDCGRTG